MKIRKPRSKGISATYIHIKDVPKDLTKEKALLYLEHNAKKWAEKYFKHSVIVKVRVEEGSLKVWVFVGSISLFEIVSNYGSFRSGIDQIVSDSKAFSSYVIEHFNEDEQVPEQAVLRVEKRLGVPGKIQRFLKALEKLNSHQLNHNERSQQIQDLQDEFLEILELLETEEDRQLFIEQAPQNIQLPPNRPLPEPIPGIISLDVFRNQDN